ncbi:unnamed protein product [Malus baccata var. baccata]
MAAMGVNEFLEGLQLIVKRMEKEEDADLILQQVVFGFWRIWKCMNEMVEVERWQQQVDDYRHAMATTVGEGGVMGRDMRDGVGSGIGEDIGEGGVGGGERVVKWQKPNFGELKLNCDAAWRKDTGEGGVGWVLRDFAGILMLAGGVGGGWFGDAIMAEAEAIRQGLEMMVGREDWKVSSRLVVESDSKGLINMLNKETTVDADLKIYKDIWRMTSLFQFVRFCFTPRQCNRAAHSIVAYIVKHDERFDWDELGPEFFFNILAEDANLIVQI